MKKNKTVKFCLFLFIAITIGIHPIFAQDSGTKTLDLGLASDEELTQALDKAGDIELINREDSLTTTAVPVEKAPAGQAAPDGIRDNEYLLESRRLAKLAEEAFSEGDYDRSARLANEAAWYAKQSDVYVAITTAKRYLDQAVVSGVSTRFPKEYKEAEDWYKESIKARDSEEWDIAIEAANIVAQLIDGLGKSISRGPALAILPATYTVRPWSVSKDCFWNIAGRSWAYGNPRQWRTLYNANKSKLPNPNNPNILVPGTILVIPSIKGEQRQGAWEIGKNYEVFK